MPGWMKHKLESRLLRVISITRLRYADDSILTVESKEQLKSLLMKVKEESEKLSELSSERTQHSKNEGHGTWSHQFMSNIWGNSRNRDRQFSWAPKSLQMVTSAMKVKDACSLKEKL